MKLFLLDERLYYSIPNGFYGMHDTFGLMHSSDTDGHMVLMGDQYHGEFL